MKFKSTYFLIILIPFLGFSSCELFRNDPGIPVNDDIWVNAYLASWQHDPETRPSTGTKIKTSEINWDAMTHMTYFSLSIAESGMPSQDLDSLGNFNSERLYSIVPAAHAHDKTIIFSVGGGGNYAGFSGAIESQNRTVFIQTIHHILKEYGFDGVNLSMPPFIAPAGSSSSQAEAEYLNYRANFSAFVVQLYNSFEDFRTNRNRKPLITIAALKNAELISLYAELQPYFDQINILSYDMAQPWRGWQAWHNSALYNKNEFFDDNPNLKFPSINRKVDEFIEEGIDRKKIGITINFYGADWEGVNLFGKWPGWPTQDMSIYSNATYPELSEAYNLAEYEWDKNAKVPFLNLENPSRFVSFENDASIREKILYAKEKRIGGVMIWELGGGFFPEKTGVLKEPLLQSVKKYAFTPHELIKQSPGE